MIPLPPLMIQVAAPLPPAPPWTPRASVSASGVSSTSASANSAEGNARLVVKCDRAAEEVVSVQFIPANPFGRAADRPVAMVFDGGTPLIANWEMPGKGAFIREDNAVTTLTNVLAHARQIKVHTTTLAGKGFDATFAGPATDAPIRQVLGACGYVLGQAPVRAPLPAATPAP